MTTLRVKCDKCGAVYDVTDQTTCIKCGAPLTLRKQGYIRIYRIGSPIGMAAGYGVYLDEVPYGHLANKGDIWIPVDPGSHSLKMTCGMTRRCEPFVFNITPEQTAVFVKAHMRMGAFTNTIVIEPANEADMPH